MFEVNLFAKGKQEKYPKIKSLLFLFYLTQFLDILFNYKLMYHFHLNPC